MSADLIKRTVYKLGFVQKLLVQKIFICSALIVTIFAFPKSVWACEPAIPLGHILFLESISRSIYLLLATMVLKCVAFIFLENKLVWWKAFLFLFLANIFSSFIGIIAIFPASAPICFPLFGLIFFLALLPSEGLAKRYIPKEKQQGGKYLIASFLTILFVLSLFSFMVAKSTSSANWSPEKYWIAKIISVYTGLIFSILTTIFYEEWFVTKLAKRKNEPTPFLTSVTRANLVALLFLMIVTAIMVVPEKIRIQDFGLLK